MQPSAQMYIQYPLISWHSCPENGQEPKLKLLENPVLLVVLLEEGLELKLLENPMLLEEGLELAVPLVPQTAPLIAGTSAAPLFFST